MSGLSPAVLPGGIPQWPEPEDWHFIKTDDESRTRFGAAGRILAQLERDTEATSEERQVYQAWHLASLANDPELRDEATQYSRDVLARDPDNYRVLAWALARRLDVDLAPTIQALSQRLEDGHASAPEIVALVVFHLQEGDNIAARSLLEKARPRFVETGSEPLWRFWMHQINAAGGEVLSSGVVDEGQRLAEDLLVTLRTTSRATGNWEPLIEELRIRATAGDAKAVFELCTLLDSLKRWDEAVPLARGLVEQVETADALTLGCVTLYHGKAYEECLLQLDSNRSLFPHSELPTEMQRPPA